MQSTKYHGEPVLRPGNGLTGARIEYIYQRADAQDASKGDAQGGVPQPGVRHRLLFFWTRRRPRMSTSSRSRGLKKGNLCDPLQVQLGDDAVGKLLDETRRERSAPRGVVESAARGVAATTAAALHEGALFNLLTTRALVAVLELPSAPPLVGVRKYNDALEEKAQVNDNTTSQQYNNTTARQHINAPTQQHTDCNITTTHRHTGTPTRQHTSTSPQQHDCTTT